MTYNIKIVKTGFHSGRLMVAFTPILAAGPITDAGITIAKSNYVYREIIDLKDKFEFSITIPYVHVNPWKNGNHGSIGNLVFTVLDPLIAPITVPDRISIIYEICGGPDFEVAVPVTTFAETPCIPYTYQMGDINSDSNPGSLGGTVIGGASIGSKEIWNASSCIGESIKSLRSVAKRFSYLAVNEASLGHTAIRVFSNTIAHNVSAIRHDVPLGRVDTITHFSMPFLLSRGGLRFKLFHHDEDERSRSFLDIGNGGMPLKTVTHGAVAAFPRVEGSNQTNLIEHVEKITGVCDLQVPQYHVSYARNVASEMCAGALATVNTAHEIVSPIILYHISDHDTDDGTHVYRAAADDFNLGFFISIPPYIAYDATPEA